jgi:hypothetical protein
MTKSDRSRVMTMGVLLCAASLAAAVTAHAQSESAFTISPGAYSVYIYNIEADKVLRRDHQIIFGESVEESLRGSRSSTARSSTVYLPIAGAVATAAILAKSYPAHARPEAERVFRELLGGYAKIERQFAIPQHDVAGAVAAFVAGSYMGYRNADFPDQHFKPLVAQMRRILASNAAFAKASNADKQAMHEQMAILGMYMAITQVTLKEKSNPKMAAEMKQAAKGYLEQFLKTDADRVQITGQGLVLR